MIEVKAKDVVDEENPMRLKFRGVKENSWVVRRVSESEENIKRVQKS